MVETATYSVKMHCPMLFLGMAVMRLATSTELSYTSMATEACPARCTCGQLSTEFRATVNCSYQQHTYVPTDFPHDTEYVMIQGNDIIFFTFPLLPNLRKLDIQANQLRTIEPFRYFPALETLIAAVKINVLC